MGFQVNPLMLSEVIAQLQALHTEHGNLPCYLNDVDTGDPLRFDIKYIAPGDFTEHGYKCSDRHAIFFSGRYDVAYEERA